MPVEGVNGFLDVESAALRAPQVGIANTNPEHILSVGSNLYVSGDSSDVLTVKGNVVSEGLRLGFIEIYPSFDLEAITTVGNVTSNTIIFANVTTGFVTTANVEVGTANLFVDTTVGRVGVGTLDPEATLHVAGDAIVTGNLTVSGTTTTVDTQHLRVTDPLIELGKDNVTEIATDLGIVMTRPAGSSNVAIVYDETATSLNIGYTLGNASQAEISMESGTPLDVNIYGNVHVSSNLEVGTANLFVDTVNSRVGVGKTNPDTALDVVGTVTATALVGTNLYGTLLGSNAASVSSLTASGDVAVNTNTLFVDTSANSVGVGTNAPASGILDVAGTLRVGNGTSGLINLGRSGTVAAYRTGLIYHDGTDLKISNQEDGDLKLATNNSNKLVIESSGNVAIDTSTFYVDAVNDRVGIGTTSPTELLDITAASGDYDAFIRLRSGSGGSPVTESGLKLTESGEFGFQFAHNAATDLLKIRHQSSAGAVDLDDIMVWKPNGNVGIGTDDPKAKLQVNGDIQLNDPEQPIGFGIYHGTHSTLDYFDTLLAKSLRRTADTTFEMQSDGNHAGFSAMDMQFRDIRFYTGTTASPSAVDVNITDLPSYERMCITTAGNVGIGTNAPDSKLNMKSGVFLAENQASTNGTVLYDDAGGSGGSNNEYAIGNAKLGVAQFVNDTGTTGSTITLMNKELANNTTKHASIGFVNTDTAGNGKFGGQIGFWPEGANAIKQQFRIYTSGTSSGYNLPVQRMVVDGDGNVGIGTTSPATPFHINKLTATTGPLAHTTTEFIRIRGDKVNGSTYAISGGIKLGGDTGGTATADGRIEFYANDGAGVSNDYGDIPDNLIMCMRGDGNVGIGTITPQSLLHVDGDVRMKTLSTNAIGKITPVYARGTGNNNAANRIVKIGDVTVVDSSTRGLTLTIINASTHAHVSSTNYDTYSATATISDSLASALEAMTDSQIGILTSADAFETMSANLVTACLKLGLTRLAGAKGDMNRHTYAAIFYGPGAAANPGNHAIEVMKTDAASGAYATLSTFLVDDSFMGQTVTNALYSGTADSTSPAVFVDKFANVGIGTTAPATKLHVNGAISQNHYARLYLDRSSYPVTTSTPLEWVTSEIEGITLAANGSNINLIEPGIYKFGLKINFDSNGSAAFNIHTQYYNGSSWVTDQYSEANQTWGGSDEFYSEYMAYAKQWTTWRLRIGPNVAVSFATTQWSRLMISKVA